MNKKHVIGYTVTALLALTIGAAGASGSSTATVAAKPVPAVTVTVPGPVVTVTVTAPAGKAAAKPTAVPAPAPATIEEGQWEVGVDVPAGVYKVTAAIDPGTQCYWSITQHGNSDNIINNDIVAGGKPTVTLKKGQDFTTQSCGTWAKVR